MVPKRLHTRDPLFDEVRMVKRIAISVDHLLREKLCLPAAKGYSNPQPICKEECIEFLQKVANSKVAGK